MFPSSSSELVAYAAFTAQKQNPSIITSAIVYKKAQVHIKLSNLNNKKNGDKGWSVKTKVISSLKKINSHALICYPPKR